MGKITKFEIDKIANTIFLGELSLDGKINRINGVLPMCIEAKELGIKTVILPNANANEAAIIAELDIIPVNTIEDVIRYLNNEYKIEKYKTTNTDFQERYNIDFAEVKGQENVKRALEITAAGGHNCVMIGSPGSGKTMLAKRIVTILPKLTIDEAMEITKIHSIAGMLENDGIIMNRPFRMPHHTVPISTMVGGGKVPRPGEISLAHDGVLFLDELTEFNRNILESLREPLENREIIINRLSGNYIYPCNFMLIASMNPCPCGYYGDIEKECKCTEQEKHRYLRKISGPLMDRIDIQIERYKKYHIYSNSEVNSRMIAEFCRLDSKGEELLQNAFLKFKLSVRAYEKILKVARTIADLEGKEKIEFNHVAEAIQYRSLDRYNAIEEGGKP